MKSGEHKKAMLKAKLNKLLCDGQQGMWHNNF
jgi:hypothetical protein